MFGGEAGVGNDLHKFDALHQEGVEGWHRNELPGGVGGLLGERLALLELEPCNLHAKLAVMPPGLGAAGKPLRNGTDDAGDAATDSSGDNSDSGWAGGIHWGLFAGVFAVVYAVGFWFWTFLLDFFFGRGVGEAPNDPKLSDGGAWRGSCEVRRRRDIQTRKKERTDETRTSQK